MKRLSRIGMALIISALGCSAAYAQPINFQLIDEQQQPLVQRAVFVFNGDVPPKLGGDMEPYPYDAGEAQKREWFIAAAQTGEGGKFSYDIPANIHKACFMGGKASRLICVEKTSDMSGTPSTDHLRIVGFGINSSEVIYNDFYDLTTQRMKRLWTNAKIEETPFTAVVLMVHPDPLPHVLGFNMLSNELPQVF